MARQVLNLLHVFKYENDETWSVKNLTQNILQNKTIQDSFMNLAKIICIWLMSIIILKLDTINNKIWELILFFLLYSTLNNVQQTSEDT